MSTVVWDSPALGWLVHAKTVLTHIGSTTHWCVTGPHLKCHQWCDLDDSTVDDGDELMIGIPGTTLIQLNVEHSQVPKFRDDDSLQRHLEIEGAILAESDARPGTLQRLHDCTNGLPRRAPQRPGSTGHACLVIDSRAFSMHRLTVFGVSSSSTN